MLLPISSPGISATMRVSKMLTATPVTKAVTQKLSAEQIVHARTYLISRGMPAAHLENVQFVRGMSGHGWIVEQALKNGNPAITRGNIVYVREDYWETATNPKNAVFWSEIFHTSQYQLGDFESNYLSGMIGSILVGGNGHRKNIMEDVAHKRCKSMADSWIKKQ
jgi:hypothetical protein